MYTIIIYRYNLIWMIQQLEYLYLHIANLVSYTSSMISWIIIKQQIFCNLAQLIKYSWASSLRLHYESFFVNIFLRINMKSEIYLRCQKVNQNIFLHIHILWYYLYLFSHKGKTYCRYIQCIHVKMDYIVWFR